MRYKKSLRLRFFFLLFPLLLFLAFPFYQKTHSLSEREKITIQNQFDQFLMEQFKQSITTDSLTLHYTLKYPNAFGISNIKPTFGDCTPFDNRETLKRLQTFPKKALTKQQKIDYEIFQSYLLSSIEGDSYFYYHTYLSPAIGIQAQLPILLSEYTLETPTDVEQYLTLLRDLDRYFHQILEIEREKVRLGNGMQDFAITEIQQQCEAFLSNPEANCLITSFDNRVHSMKTITVAKKKQWSKQNRQIVFDSVLPAYETLITELETLKGGATITGGLCHLKGGTNYYRYLVKHTTGVNLSIPTLENQIKRQLQKGRSTLQTVLVQDPDLLQRFVDSTCPLTEPKEILSTLESEIENDFPKITPVLCELKTVDPSLAQYVSPAFYLTPTIDDLTNNTIYINSLSSSYQAETLYPTLAHEGYPGHLFQTIYFYQTSPHPIRSLLNFGGYIEGWATYVEYHSYEHLDYGSDSSAFALLHQFQMDFSLGISSLVDIGVHYHGWDLAQCKQFLASNGIKEESVAEQLYHHVIEEPANYLKYYIGFLQFESLRLSAQKNLGRNFDLKTFHKAVLDLGSAPFYIVEKEVRNDLNF